MKIPSFTGLYTTKVSRTTTTGSWSIMATMKKALKDSHSSANKNTMSTYVYRETVGTYCLLASHTLQRL